MTAPALRPFPSSPTPAPFPGLPPAGGFRYTEPVPAPKPGCRCAVCTWTTLSAAPTPIRPSDPAWPILLRMAEAWEETR